MIAACDVCPPRPVKEAGRGPSAKAVILCHRFDLTAERVSAVLRRALAVEAVELVYFDELILAPRLTYRFQKGKASSEFQFRDGRLMRSDELGIVFNRLRYVGVPHFRGAEPEEREYARSETFALLVSWLQSLECPVINPISAQSLQGRLISPLGWQILARNAGLAPAEFRIVTSQRRYPERNLAPLPESATLFGQGFEPPLRLNGRSGNLPGAFGNVASHAMRTVLVLGNYVLGALDKREKKACANLAAASNFNVLRLQFVQVSDSRGWVFVGADPIPELTTSVEIAALADFLLHAKARVTMSLL